MSWRMIKLFLSPFFALSNLLQNSQMFLNLKLFPFFVCFFFLLDLCLIKNTCWSGNEPFSPFIQHACCVGCCWDLGRHARASIYMVCTCICTLFLYLYLYLSCCFCSNVLKRVGLPVDMHVTGIATISWLAIKLQKSMMVGFTSCMFVSCLHTIFFKLDLCTK